MTRSLARGFAVLPVCLGMLTLSCAPRSSLDLFDPIVTEDLIRKGCENDVPFGFWTDQNARTRSYGAHFILGTDHPESHAYVSITVSRAGRLLKPREYQRYKREVRKLDKGRPPEMQWGPALFPDIGKKAMVGLIVSPNGGGDSVTFTTNDGRFDIEVEQGNHLAKGLEGPNVLCEKIAREICRLYDNRAER